MCTFMDGLHGDEIVFGCRAFLSTTPQSLTFSTVAHKYKRFYFTDGASTLHTSPSTLHTSPSTLQVELLLYKGSFYFTDGASTLHTELLQYRRRFYFTHQPFYFTSGASTLQGALLLYRRVVETPL